MSLAGLVGCGFFSNVSFGLGLMTPATEDLEIIFGVGSSVSQGGSVIQVPPISGSDAPTTNIAVTIIPKK